MTLASSIAQLSFGALGNAVARVHQACKVLGGKVAIAEVETRTFGLATAATVKALHVDIGVPATGIVDVATVEAINATFMKQATAQHTLRGRVADAVRNPAKGLSVHLYREDEVALLYLVAPSSVVKRDLDLFYRALNS
jgi:hypothetical protein